MKTKSFIPVLMILAVATLPISAYADVQVLIDKGNHEATTLLEKTDDGKFILHWFLTEGDVRTLRVQDIWAQYGGSEIKQPTEFSLDVTSIVEDKPEDYQCVIVKEFSHGSSSASALRLVCHDPII